MSPCVRAAAMLTVACSLVMLVAHAQQNDLPPTEGVALLKWLQAGSYRKWPKESAPHRSMGPHKALVITYLNPTLDRSLESKAATHPKGSAAVKELLDEGGKLAGWAVSVKSSAESESGKGWYWYEQFGTTSSGSVVSQSHGEPLCSGCHTRGRDYVLIPHPLD
jgi:hypothetical protein